MALNLPDQAKAQAEWRKRGFQKGATRLEEKAQKDITNDRAWEDCCKAVDKRDGVLCRHCGKRTVKTLELLATRAEHAHIVRRKKEKALMFDSRNVLLLCHRCHAKFDKHEIELLGTKADQFEHNGKRYLNADSQMLKWAKVA